MESASEQGGRGRIFDLDAIAAALNNPKLGRSADEASVERRMLHGYAFVDELLATGRDPFVYGGSSLLVEMNHIVLCGVTPARRAEFAPHIAATERRFYEDHLCGADSFYAWVERNAYLRPLPFAARVFRRIVVAPQLFIEGNQRTASLVASYILGRPGLSPLVRTADDCEEFDALSAGCKGLDRRWLTSVIPGRALDWKLERFIARTADPAFLLRARGGSEPDARPFVNASEG